MLLNEAGFVLRALGRLPEAVQPMRAGLDAYVVEKNWQYAARCAGNLSGLTLTLGEVAGPASTSRPATPPPPSVSTAPATSCAPAATAAASARSGGSSGG